MTLPKPTGDVTVRRARALADSTRRALLDQLRSAPADVRELADRSSKHENAVRQHLAVLRDAGLVVEDVAHDPGRVGRPRALYRATDTSLFTVNPFERLAALLVDVAAGHDAIEVGRAEGLSLATDCDGDTVDVVADIAATHGFAVHVERRPGGARIALGACPFASVAGSVVCALHRGIAEGAAHAAGGAVTRFDIADPAVRPCELTLAPHTGGAR